MTLIRQAVRTLTAGFLAVLVTASPGFAQSQAGPERETAGLAGALLDRLHTREAIQAWQKMLQAPTALPACGCGAEAEAKITAAWQTAVSGAFDVPGAYSEMQRAFAESFTAGELRSMIAFRDTPLGRKLSALERPPAVEPDPAESLAEIERMRKALAADPVRRKALEELVAAMGGIESQIDLIINISLGSALGEQGALPAGQPRLTQQEIIAMVENNRAPLRRGLGPILLYSYAAIYQSLTLEEVREYRDGLQSELGRKAVRVELGAFNHVMRAQALAIGARFATEFAAQDM